MHGGINVDIAFAQFLKGERERCIAIFIEKAMGYCMMVAVEYRSMGLTALLSMLPKAAG